MRACVPVHTLSRTRTHRQSHRLTIKAHGFCMHTHDDARAPMITRGTLHPCMHNTNTQRDTDAAVRPMAWPASLRGRVMGLDGKLGRLCSTSPPSAICRSGSPLALIEAKDCCVRRRSGATAAEQSTAPEPDERVAVPGAPGSPSCRCLLAVSDRH
jgi:hypothetical protein